MIPSPWIFCPSKSKSKQRNTYECYCTDEERLSKDYSKLGVVPNVGKKLQTIKVNVIQDFGSKFYNSSF